MWPSSTGSPYFPGPQLPPGKQDGLILGWHIGELNAASLSSHSPGDLTGVPFSGAVPASALSSSGSGMSCLLVMEVLARESRPREVDWPMAWRVSASVNLQLALGDVWVGSHGWNILNSSNSGPE